MDRKRTFEAEALRDFLYQKMRGARGLDDRPGEPASAGGAIAPATAANDEATALLRDIRDALVTLASQKGPQS